MRIQNLYTTTEKSGPWPTEFSISDNGANEKPSGNCRRAMGFGNYQMMMRLEGAMYILSVFLTP